MERKGKERKRKEKFMLFSDHNGSLLRRQLKVFCMRECTSQPIADVKLIHLIIMQ